ncbi:MAG: 6-carboxytetrahydropterin synthase, partial [Planctomycetes bacterium]|nr:6-carboxytetrahydropterin synthase [Planctomycetota bacterium]
VRFRDGSVEPRHGHDWVVRAEFARAELDECGMVVDFLEARRVLDAISGDLHHTDLNEHPALGGANPTAEAVARYVFDRVRDAGLTDIRRVEVTEAPGCIASFSE